jgi:hypothetical protein
VGEHTPPISLSLFTPKFPSPFGGSVYLAAQMPVPGGAAPVGREAPVLTFDARERLRQLLQLGDKITDADPGRSATDRHFRYRQLRWRVEMWREGKDSM